MEGPLSDSGSDVHVPDDGLRCAEPEPLWVGSEDEASQQEPTVKLQPVEECGPAPSCIAR